MTRPRTAQLIAPRASAPDATITYVTVPTSTARAPTRRAPPLLHPTEAASTDRQPTLVLFLSSSSVGVDEHLAG